MPRKQTFEDKQLNVPTVSKRDFRLREQKNNDWRVKLPPSVTPDQCKDSDYLSRVLALGGDQFSPYDEVTLIGGGGDWCVKVLVGDSGIGWVDTVYIWTVVLPESKAQNQNRIPDGFSIVKDRESGKYGAYRDSDNHPFIEGARSHEDALRMLLDKAAIRDVVRHKAESGAPA